MKYKIKKFFIQFKGFSKKKIEGIDSICRMPYLNKMDQFASELPIHKYKDQILQLICENPIVMITGEPGSGKTTQIPQYLLESSDLPRILKSSKLKIAITQPRRVAAIAMARRVSYERKCGLGKEVGYSIRFEDCTSSKTQIKYMTDGVLLREALQDNQLSRYSVVILDEAHERSLDTDILLGLLKQVVQLRKDFRLVVTSATLDIELFQNYLGNCPLIQIEGRQYEVEVLHSAVKSDLRVEFAVNAAIRIHLHEGLGDVLVFLTGSEECEKACRVCFDTLQKLVAKGKPVPSMMILPLYGAMPSEEQSKVFKPCPEDTRKVIFSTNIAETSLTINGIGFVIDCGYIKQKAYNPRTGLDALMVTPISKQQAKQRAGRAGRTQEGKCFRLYSESFFEEQMAESAVAEIKRVNLSSTILTLKALDIRDVINFGFIEPPDHEALLMAHKQLFLIGALDEDGSITELGRSLASLPLEPTYSRCLIASLIFKSYSEMLSLVAMLSTENIWQNVPKMDLENTENAKQAQLQFIDKSGDHVTYLKVFDSWRDNEYSEAWCYENFINARALRQARDIRGQLKTMIKNFRISGLPEEKLYNELMEKKALSSDSSIRLRLALCFGFYMNAARAVSYGQEGSYLSVSDGTMLHVDKQSSISILGKYPPWIIYTHLSGSTLSHGSLKVLSKIRSEWIEDLTPKLSQANLERLVGLQKQKRPREPSINEEKEAEDPAIKVNQARERYLKRKVKNDT
ncbi:DHX40 [Blepharisma stoltei]|uniref:RNA helicase n=1 Tax=Blepharisma stoltei TaxID=1481888 RepID=A0AAU9J306_9CILI|nr:unnamed protein product [Blepharisma stoltei]